MMTSLFLSYAWGDDDPFVRRLYNDLTARGFDVWWDRVNMPSRDLSFFREIEEAIAVRHRLVLVVGPKAIASDHVTAEWQFALDSGKPVNPVLRLGDYDTIPRELQFLDTPDFRPDADYAHALEALVRHISEPPAPLGKLVGVPDLPPHFVRHRERIVALKENMIADFERRTVITGVHGMGGIGKSVLANALVRDFQTRRHFPDGIVWVTVGQWSDPASLQAQLAGALGEEQHFATVEQGKRRLREMLSEKAALLVLDDVWEHEQAEAFDVLAPRCRALITTRDASLVTSLGGTDHEVQLLSDAEAKRLLAEWMGCPEADLPAAATEVIEECDRLPLAISICGAMLRDGTPWKDVVAALREADPHFIDHTLRNYPYTSAFKSIKVSVDALEPEARQRCVELCAFHHDAAIPEGAIETLWNYTGGLTGRHVRALLTRLERRSLIRLASSSAELGPPDALRVSLHDLVYDYIGSLAEDVGRLQETLLSAYRQRCPEGWHSGPNDGYFLQQLCRHLTELGRWDELEATLTDLDFVDAKSRAGLVYNLMADYNRAEWGWPGQKGKREEEEEYQVQIARYAQDLIAHSRDPDGTSLPEPPGAVDIPPTQPVAERRDNWTPLERIREWSRFVANHPQWLGNGTTPAHQLAWNSAAGGPVVEAMETRDPPRHPWLRLENRPPYSPRPACLRVLEGHGSGVTAVALTPDCRRALSAGWDRRVRSWDLETGECLAALEGHTRWVSAVALTPDGQRAVSGGGDGTLRVWDVDTGDCLAVLEGHTDDVNAVALTADGRRAVSGGGDGTLRVWDVEAGDCLRVLEGHTDSLNAVALTADGRRAVSGGGDGTLRVWDVETGDCLRVLEGHTGGVWDVALTPDGRQAVSGGEDKVLRLWDVETGSYLGVLGGHASWVRAIALTADGRWAISGGTALRIWDLESGECLAALEGHTQYVHAVAITPDGRRVVSASEDGALRVWDPQTGDRLTSLKHGVHSSIAVGPMPVGPREVSMPDGRAMRVRHLRAGEGLGMPEGHMGRARVIALAPDGRRLMSISGPETLRVWDVGTGKCLRVLEGHDDWISVVTFAPDGRRAMSGSNDGCLRVWDVESGECLAVLEGHTNLVDAIAATPDGCRAVSASTDFDLRLWDLETGECLRLLRGHKYNVTAVAVTGGGRRAVSGSADRTLRVWDLETGDCLRLLEGHTRGVWGIALSADDRWAVSASSDHTLRLWELKTGECLGRHPAYVWWSGVALSGTNLLAGTLDERVALLAIENVALGACWTTATRLWLYSEGGAAGRWDDRLTAVCPRCGRRFAVDDSWMGHSFPCPLGDCGGPLRLNPFVCDPTQSAAG